VKLPSLKGGICRETGWPKKIAIANTVGPARARGVFLADQMITPVFLNGKGRLPLS
jgi:hypothetical protein